MALSDILSINQKQETSEMYISMLHPNSWPNTIANNIDIQMKKYVRVLVHTFILLWLLTNLDVPNKTQNFTRFADNISVFHSK